jgi:hypothetical protein
VAGGRFFFARTEAHMAASVSHLSILVGVTWPGLAAGRALVLLVFGKASSTAALVCYVGLGVPKSKTSAERPKPLKMDMMSNSKRSCARSARKSNAPV